MHPGVSRAHTFQDATSETYARPSKDCRLSYIMAGDNYRGFPLGDLGPGADVKAALTDDSTYSSGNNTDRSSDDAANV